MTITNLEILQIYFMCEELYVHTRDTIWNIAVQACGLKLVSSHKYNGKYNLIKRVETLARHLTDKTKIVDLEKVFLPKDRQCFNNNLNPPRTGVKRKRTRTGSKKKFCDAPPQLGVLDSQESVGSLSSSPLGGQKVLSLSQSSLPFSQEVAQCANDTSDEECALDDDFTPWDDNLTPCKKKIRDMMSLFEVRVEEARTQLQTMSIRHVRNHANLPTCHHALTLTLTLPVECIALILASGISQTIYWEHRCKYWNDA